MPSLSREQLLYRDGKHICKHCNKEAQYKREFYSGSYDFDTHYLCDCDTSVIIEQLRSELCKVSEAKKGIELSLKEHLDVEHVDIRNDKVRTEAKNLLQKFGIEVEELEGVLYELKDTMRGVE